MLRFLILSGYFELMMYLQVSGKLDQFICSFGFSSAVFVGQKRKSRRKGTRARS